MSEQKDNLQKTFKTCINTIRNRLLEDLTQSCNQYYSLNATNRSNLNLSYQQTLNYERLFAWLKSPERAHEHWEDNLKDLVKERAYTLTNRLVILMQLERRDLRNVKLISKGLEGSALRTEQDLFVALIQGDDQGFGFMLQQVWDQLALELPALFEFNEIHECIPVPGPTLLWLIQALNEEGLAPAWLDDTTLGWLYQYWNDPDRKAVDAKLNNTSGKVEVHELANKTQLFTERYMVEWLVQNSLGTQWLAICAKQGWSPKAKEKIAQLESTRATWNQKIAANEVAETEAMPVNGDEVFWKYYVPQDIAPETIEAAPLSLDQVKILDPAMGSGHFLVYVFDFLWELYQDQARLQNKESYTPKQTLDWILNNNLHGIDIDNRAVQIGAAALYIKAKEKSPDYQLENLNLVASDLGMSHLTDDDPAIIEFTNTLEAEVGLQKELSLQIISALKGAEYLGSLLQIDEEIERAFKSNNLLTKGSTIGVNIEDIHKKIFESISKFIKSQDYGDDLGVKTIAKKLSKGLRVIKILSEKYDVVTGNPPYLSKGKVSPVIDKLFKDGANELYEVMVFRSKSWLKEEGFLAFLSTHNFMFLEKFKGFRSFIKREGVIHCLAQLGVWTFQDVSQPGALGIALFIWQKSKGRKDIASYQRIGSGQHRTDPKFENKIPLLTNQYRSYKYSQSRFADVSGSPMIYWWPEEFRLSYLNSPKLKDIGETKVGLQTGNNDRYVRFFWEVSTNKINISRSSNKWSPYLKGAKGRKWFESVIHIINWRNDGKEIKNYFPGGVFKRASRPQSTPFYFKQGIAFSYIGTDGFLCRLRKYQSIFDVSGSSIFSDNPEKLQTILSSSLSGYVSQSINPTVNNQVGDIENLPVFDQLKDYSVYIKRAENLYGDLFNSTETNLEYIYRHLGEEKFVVEEARIRDDIDKEMLKHFSLDTVSSIYQEIGASVFDYPLWDGRVESIPKCFEVSYQAQQSLLKLSRQFRLHPDSLLKIKETLGLTHDDHRQDKAFKDLSWSIGVLLGRFDAQTGGLVDLAETRRKDQNLTPDSNAPQGHNHGLIYLSVLDDHDGLNRDEQPNVGNACLNTLKSILEYKWGAEKAAELWREIEDALVLDCRADWTPAQRAKKDLNTWIRTSAFAMHESVYSKRPIYFPLVSAKKSFFVWVNIHQWHDGTLNSILANYLNPDSALLTARIKRLREDRQSITDSRELNAIEKEIAGLDKELDELDAFIAKVTQLATRGPAPALQENEAPYVMDLDDGVMVNASALWELVLPLWKDPKKWWSSLAAPKGKKDFDWSHLAMRYWPMRVFAKVKQDPSLAVAHSDYGYHEGHDLFTELHPEAAEKWEEQQGKQPKTNYEMDV